MIRSAEHLCWNATIAKGARQAAIEAAAAEFAERVRRRVLVDPVVPSLGDELRAISGRLAGGRRA